MMNKLIYPVGLQDFGRIRETKMVYVDKTALVYKMANEGDAYFLSRPRRFGKSLLISTLKYYFEGRRDLFEGLAIDSLETEWRRYPVLKLDMSRGKYDDLSRLHDAIDLILHGYEQHYGLEPKPGLSYGARLTMLIDKAFADTGERVVVLIDEYDAPMLDSLDDEERLTQIRNIMRDFYSPLKAMAEKLRFVFLTGITKFSQMSIFSELNNLNNISMVPGWDAICGITSQEIGTYMGQGVRDLARCHDCTPDEMMERLKAYYDGYHFTKAMVDVYNPFSLVKTFQNKDLSCYWFESGSPTWLFGLLARTQVEIDSLEGINARPERFERPAERVGDAVPVLFQSGYLTIKGYDRLRDQYTLGIPNREVREGLGGAMLQFVKSSPDRNEWLRDGYFDWFEGGDISGFMELLTDFYASIPYDISNDNERHYQAILYAVLASFGADVACEDRTARGRADLVLRMPQAIYVIELKYGKTVEAAMEQLHAKDYAAKYRHDGRPVHLLGINLATDTRTLDGWLLE